MSDRAHRPEAGDRRLLGFTSGHPPRGQPGGGGLAQVILGFGQDELGFGRPETPPRAELTQVLLDEVAGSLAAIWRAHADHPGTGRTGPAAGRPSGGAGQPSTACTLPA